jgi:hypothetical protein
MPAETSRTLSRSPKKDRIIWLVQAAHNKSMTNFEQITYPSANVFISELCSYKTHILFVIVC